MQADASFLNHVQGGPQLAQAFRMEAGPLRNTARAPDVNRYFYQSLNLQYLSNIIQSCWSGE